MSGPVPLQWMLDESDLWRLLKRIVLETPEEERYDLVRTLERAFSTPGVGNTLAQMLSDTVEGIELKDEWYPDAADDEPANRWFED